MPAIKSMLEEFTVGLSKRGWNNVLMFSCMAMIIIFNLMGDKLVDNAEGDIVPILPEQSMILTLEYPNYSIERLGRGWRVAPANHLTTELTEQVINTWLALQGEVTLTDSDEAGYRVKVWLAGSTEPQRFWIQPQAGLITDVLNQQSWRVAPNQLMALESITPESKM
ncbi:hypothetical protein [Psychrobium sp. 1_MG-2023]|uniref:hypothetical protein n=1 Tax=Psychrobium sp. 1_MG-2023 TaxID=3062624 RepID=UPI000C33E8FA|nr:hypothetical protein [Psychrobium sp. 1_MG-2023]MDP2562541.1 hypothetical protein [Psychrobium sp. 1_MG-2023]PKF57968.1 hypothetical protein CW748_05465 [Alteromonadales bacterium alter-6D02]